MKKSAAVAAVAVASVAAQNPVSTVTFTSCEPLADATLTASGTVTVTFCPICTETSTVGPGGTTWSTIYETVYQSWCPTGLGDHTYTITETCVGPVPTYHPGTPGPAPGFTSVYESCTVCPAPTTTWMTYPPTIPPGFPTGVPVPPPTGCPGGVNCPPVGQVPPSSGCPGGVNCPPVGQVPPSSGCPGGVNCPPVAQVPPAGSPPPYAYPPSGGSPPSSGCPGGLNCPPVAQVPPSSGCPGGVNCPETPGSSLCPGPYCVTGSGNMTIVPYTGAAAQVSLGMIATWFTIIGVGAGAFLL